MDFPERRTIRILLTILLFAFACAITYSVRRVILVFVLSVSFAYLINPAVSFMERHSLRFRSLRGAAVAEVYVGILILIALLTHSLAPTLIKNVFRAVDQVPIVVDGLSTGEIANDIGAKYGWSDQQKDRLRTVLVRHKDNFQGVQRWIDSSLSEAAQIMGWMALIPILAIFLLRDGGRITGAVIETSLPPKYWQSARMIAGELHVMLTRYIWVQVCLCVFSLVFYLSVLLLFRFPHPFALAFLGAMLEFVPVIGWMSTAAVILGIGVANDLSWMWMAGLLLLWRVAQDYFNLPRVLGHKLEIHPLIVIFAVLAGAETGGIVGIYLAVPLTTALLIIWRRGKAHLDAPFIKSLGDEVAAGSS